MAGQDTLVKEQLSEYIVDLQTLNFPHGSLYKEWLNALTALVLRTKQLYTRSSMTGEYVSLTENDLGDLVQLYDKAIRKGERFLKKMGSSNDCKAACDICRKVNRLLYKDRSYISELPETLARQLIEGKASMPRVMEYARNLLVNANQVQVHSEKGMQNERLPLTVNDASGRSLQGYFTRERFVTGKAEAKELLEEFIKTLNDKEKTLFNKNMLDALPDNRAFAFYNFLQSFSGNVRSDKNCPQAQDPYRAIRDCLCLSRCISDKESDQLKKDYEAMTPDQRKAFDKKIVSFMAGHTDQFLNVMTSHFMQGMEGKEGLASRNCAMTAVADLLGMPGIIARSVPMTLKKGKETISGIFMEKAVGEDLAKITGDSKLANVTQERQYNTPQLKKQLAQLQVLDYICGNTDRHAFNMLYRFDEAGNIVGVQGIDNDSSFPGIEVDTEAGNGMGCSVVLKYMKVIPRETAERIALITPEMLRCTLSGYQLSENAIDKACERLQRLQNRLLESSKAFASRREGYLQVVDPKDWRKLPPMSELADSKRRNIFERFHNHTANFAETIRNELDRIQENPAPAQENEPKHENEPAQELVADQYILKRKPEAATMTQLKAEARIYQKLLLNLMKVNPATVKGSREFDRVLRDVTWLTWYTQQLTQEDKLNVRKAHELRNDYQHTLGDLGRAIEAYQARKDAQFWHSSISKERQKAVAAVGSILEDRLQSFAEIAADVKVLMPAPQEVQVQNGVPAI